MIREYICNYCDKKCIVTIDEYDNSFEFDGNECDKGIEYALNRINNHLEYLTTLVRIKGDNISVVPVKSTEPIDMKLHLRCSKALSRLYVGTPIKIGEIICKNILNTGVDIVCAKDIEKS